MLTALATITISRAAAPAPAESVRSGVADKSGD